MTLPALAVTGSTGHIGGLVAAHLADAGVAQRILARTPEKAPTLPGAVAVRSSYENTEESRASLAGVDLLFMVSGSESAERLNQHRAFIDAAAAAEVGHIVYLSFFGAAPDATFTLARDHWATEQHIIASGVPFTFLRDNFYTDFFSAMVGDDGVLRGPAGNGRVASVTRADVARVAATVLQSPTEHIGQTYDLTGPEALTFDDIAQTITEITGRSVSYHNETVEEAYESRRAWEAPQWHYDAWVSTYTAIAAGELVPVSGDVERITGRQPESLRDFLTQERE
ncbi:SDR family oxidoreductase [Microbacterium schleiferi]|uniref:SDR family oxidoreductase n=1 Tax=Microbacterium schleiferi TaxID=69362 RepID=A0A7S8MWJ5_9MICO|nr:SDR family oxidoreductase [Microbacterium schleiferi]QPE03978.1 SDR family oxidoreductase [Microbacterium schleiferi]